VNVAGGWYHITNRGNNYGPIFLDRRDREHFLELLAMMRDLYRVHVYAYVLMGNHYHLLIGTPEANASRAIQWLNVSYGMWHNKRHHLAGHLFQGRFKGILVEGGEWGLELSVYMHLNPVVTKREGLGKGVRAAQRAGLSIEPTVEQVERRLEKLRKYEWSSYRAYGGYGKKLEWLDMVPLLERAADAAADQTSAYRELVEDRLRQGAQESPWKKLKWGVVLGGERFARRVRGKIQVLRETEGRHDLRKLRTMSEIIVMVERMKKEKWDSFRDRHGDFGRDLALWAGRRYGALTLGELGKAAGGIDYAAVTMAIKRLEVKAGRSRQIRFAMCALREKCEKITDRGQTEFYHLTPLVMVFLRSIRLFGEFSVDNSL